MFFKGMRGVSFVCLDDITGVPMDLNKVIYNPNIDDPSIISDKLFKDIKEAFDVQLSNEELASLTSYDANHLDEFTSELRQIVKNKRGG